MNARRSPGRSATGREAAVRAISDVLQGRGFAVERLRALRQADRLDPREGALAREIALGAVRHCLTLDAVLGAVATFDRRRVAPTLRAILYAAAYQIIWMDRVPVYAAVDQAVQQARQLVGQRSTAMVNAVLRRLERAIAERRTPWCPDDPTQVRVSWSDACAFNAPVLPTPDTDERRLAYIAAATGERLARVQLLVGRHGVEDGVRVAWANQGVPAVVLQRNTLRISADDFSARARAELGDTADVQADCAFAPAGTHLADVPLFVEGLAYVQDPTAHRAARSVDAAPGQRVLDLCAAPGGKSVVLAQQMRGQGEVVACDQSPERLRMVADNVARLGLTCVQMAASPTADPDDMRLDTFDAALVDAPCSNTGVIARRPEARLGLTPQKLLSLARTQVDLLHLAARHVRRGGRLVYSTCSLEPDENEQVVRLFLAEQPGWRLVREETWLPNWGPQLADWRDGGYVARLTADS